jgi:hypothetical protein
MKYTFDPPFFSPKKSPKKIAISIYFLEKNIIIDVSIPGKSLASDGEYSIKKTIS